MPESSTRRIQASDVMLLLLRFSTYQNIIRPLPRQHKKSISTPSSAAHPTKTDNLLSRKKIIPKSSREEISAFQRGAECLTSCQLMLGVPKRRRSNSEANSMTRSPLPSTI
jgi:hypothetical protein